VTYWVAVTTIELLAVDDPNLLLALQWTFVRREGCRVLTAADPQETLLKARAARPAVVILDADGWGVEGCRALKLDPGLADTPVVLLASDPRLARRAAPAAAAVVPKPLAPRALLAAIRGLVPVAERSGARRSASLPVTFERGGEQGRSFTKDLGPDGLFLRVAPPPPVGQSLSVTFVVPGPEGPTIRATARVVRAVGSGRDSHLLAGAGLRFVDLGEGERRALERFVEAGA